MQAASSDEDEGDDEASLSGSGEGSVGSLNGIGTEKKVMSHFTEYSMSSSVIPRSEGLWHVCEFD